LVTRLAAQARAQGVSLLGRDGLLQQLTKRLLEACGCQKLVRGR
jgi:hypothetical protein